MMIDADESMSRIHSLAMRRKAVAYWAGFLRGLLADGAIGRAEGDALAREASRFATLFDDGLAQAVVGDDLADARQALMSAEAALGPEGACDATDRINVFLGFCAGVITDGAVTRPEVAAIHARRDDPALRDSAPCLRILDIAAAALQDAEIDPEEAREISHAITALVGNAYGAGSLGEAHWPDATVTDPDEIEIDGGVVVLTGPMRLGPRREIVAMIEARGGRVASSVSRKVDYVVISQAASAYWRQTHYGVKIEKAANLMADGAEIVFVAEEALEALLSRPVSEPDLSSDAVGLVALREHRAPATIATARDNADAAEPDDVHPPRQDGPTQAGAAAEDDAEPQPAEAEVSIVARVASKVTLASHQNDAAVIGEITLVNRSERELNGLVLRLEADPPVIGARDWTIDRLAPQDEMSIRDRRVNLAGGYLESLTEAMRADVMLSLRHGATEIASTRRPITALARNEWGGASTMPELLAAFVTPNDPGVAGLMREASQALEASGQDPALEGYQGGSRKRVWTLAAALWSAIQARRLVYAEPPASFESDGQKIRLPSLALEQGLATCLDSSALFAACLEQIGLNAVVAFTRGHAFCGVWLQPQTLPALVVEEAEVLRKALDANDLILFETTLATAGRAVPFAKAAREAARQIAECEEDRFVYALDLRQARSRGIQPLASVAAAGGDATAAPTSGPAPVDLPPDLPDFDDLARPEAAPQTPQERTDLWRRRLLDLSKRNRLLNLKASKTAIPLFCTDLGELEDQLSAGRRIAFTTPPPAPVEEVGQDAGLHRMRTGDDLSERHATEQLARGAVVANLDEKKLDDGLVALFRKARTDLEEGGANTLFLVIGMLRWTPIGQTTSCRAPLIMKPVRLDRPSARSRPFLRAHDDDTVVNMTLMELLRRDFDIRVPETEAGLPEDDSGVDVAAILQAFRRAVRDAPGIEVREDVVLSTFSFAKYLMWKDLDDRAEALREAPFVRHLVDSPREAYERGARFLDARSLDREIDPADLHMPFHADSGQTVAVHASGGDGDFVLEGPPGTGKSETICNIIAHNLALGRKVLFVSEKMAALEVVRERLASRGLDRFCLDLHAHHANKKAVIDHLDRAWAAADVGASAEWRAHAEELGRIRDALNGLAAALHAPGRTGVSPREAIGRAARYGDIHTLRLDWPMNLREGDRAGDAEGLARLVAIAHEAGRAFGALEADDLAAFEMVGAQEWSNTWATRLRESAGRLGAAVRSLRASMGAMAAAFGLPAGLGESPDMRVVEVFDELARVALDPDAARLGFVLEPTGRGDLEAVAAAVVALEAFAAARAAFEADRKARPVAVDALRDADVEAWRAAREAAETRRWPFRGLALGRLRTEIAASLKLSSKRDALALIEPVAGLQAALAAAEAAGRAAPRSASFWRGLDTDPKAAGALILKAEALRAMAARLEALHPTGVRAALRRAFGDGADGLSRGLPMGDAAQALRDDHVAFCEARVDFLGQAQAGRRADPLDAVETVCGLIAARAARLNAWVAWVSARRAAEQAGLGALTRSLVAGETPPEAATEAFRTAYRVWIAPLLIDADDALRTFQAGRHEEMIGRFRALDEEIASVTAAHIRAKLSGEVPGRGERGLPSGFGVLQREVQKKLRHKPVRKLIEEMGPSLTRLTPCLMMSPMSVAQFMPPDASLFDLVIFDEASQITVPDAIGAIARGKRTIVVGDPKQMPPTSFFDKAAEETEDDDSQDLESILDEALASGAPLHRLTGHYRSRHESLIAFSNHAYYDSALVTYPSADTRDSAVSFRRVNGVYARGKGRTNAIEARAVADDVVRRLSDPALSRLSLGVVTFNAEQQRLVLDLLDRARREQPELEAFFDESAAEPVFVKNLETVQGDQRDVILLSVGYGPTAPGAPTMPMNFGPLNRTGGERRLNVAITRATTEVVAFASFDPPMIDLTRTSARAVHDLRNYLDFAARGPAARGEAPSSFGAEDQYDSDFEMAVASALRDRGWTVRTQVGVSRFRVDLGVVHPDEPGRFLVGVECDGASYHGSPTARDRDRVRQAILERLGWTLLRVWSTDYFVDPRARMERLHADLTAILEADRARMAQERADEGDAGLHGDGALDAGDLGDALLIEGDAIIALPAPEVAGRLDDVEDAEIVETAVDADSDEAAPTWRRAAAPASPSSSDATRAVASPAVARSADDFYDDASFASLRARAQEIIDEEGPVTADRLASLVAREHGLMRTGATIRSRVAKAVGRTRPASKDRAGAVIWWPSTVTPAQRAPFRGLLGRDWRSIAEPELVDAAARHLGAEDPVRSLAEEFGVRRLRASARAEIEEIVDLARRAPAQK